MDLGQSPSGFSHARLVLVRNVPAQQELGRHHEQEAQESGYDASGAQFLVQQIEEDGQFERNGPQVVAQAQEDHDVVAILRQQLT